MPQVASKTLKRRYLAALWMERGWSPVDASAPIDEQVKQEAAADYVRRYRRTSVELLTDWVHAETGKRIPAKVHPVRSAIAGDVTEIFTDSIGASVMRGYFEGLGSVLGWTSREILAQRKAERIGLTAPPYLNPVAVGEFAGSDGDNFARSESYLLGRFAKYQAIDEQDLQDDTLGLLTTIPMQHGRAAARLAVDLAFAELLSNPAMEDGNNFFSAAFGNLGTGALSGTTLDEAMSKLLAQEEAGVPLNLRPKYLLVPPALYGTARKLARERKNDDEGDLVVLSDSRLTETRDPTTAEAIAGSDTSWYLAADGEDGAVELGYLRKDTPTVRSGPLTDGEFGVFYDIAIFVAAKAIRPRSIVRYV